MRILIVIRGIADLGPLVDERLPKFWEEYVKNHQVPAVTRKNALTAWLWVRAHLRRHLTVDYLNNLTALGCQGSSNKGGPESFVSHGEPF